MGTPTDIGSTIRSIVLDAVKPILWATVLTAALLLMIEADPIEAAEVLWHSTFGSLRSFGEGLVRSAPLLMIATTLVPSLKARLYNIGAPGQVGAGALASTLVALNMPNTPSIIVVCVCGLCAAAAGAALAFMPGYAKARWNVNEVVSTLAMNFIMFSFLGFVLSGPLQSDYANLPQSEMLPASSALPLLFNGTRAHVGLLVAMCVVPFLMLLSSSYVGYKLRIFGSNPELAKRAGVNPNRYLIMLMMFGGLGAGLAGWMQVTSIDHRLYPGVADPIGYAGLFVALLGGLNPIGCFVAALLLGALLYGASALQVGASVSPEIVQVFLGLVLLVYAIRPNQALNAPGR